MSVQPGVLTPAEPPALESGGAAAGRTSGAPGEFSAVLKAQVPRDGAGALPGISMTSIAVDELSSAGQARAPVAKALRAASQAGERVREEQKPQVPREGRQKRPTGVSETEPEKKGVPNEQRVRRETPAPAEQRARIAPRQGEQAAPEKAQPQAGPVALRPVRPAIATPATKPAERHEANEPSAREVRSDPSADAAKPARPPEPAPVAQPLEEPTVVSEGPQWAQAADQAARNLSEEPTAGPRPTVAQPGRPGEQKAQATPAPARPVPESANRDGSNAASKITEHETEPSADEEIRIEQVRGTRGFQAAEGRPAPAPARDAAPSKAPPSTPVQAVGRAGGIALKEVPLPKAVRPIGATPGKGQPEAPAASARAQTAAAQFSRGLSAALRQGGGAVTLRLQPENLGDLKIRLEMEAGKVAAQFRVETAQARQLLDETLGSLRTALEARGLEVQSLSVHVAERTNPAPEARGQPEHSWDQGAGGRGSPDQGTQQNAGGGGGAAHQHGARQRHGWSNAPGPAGTPPGPLDPVAGTLGASGGAGLLRLDAVA